MYAVIMSGGKQYRVIEGQTLKLEKITAEAGEKIIFGEVLMLAQDEKVQIGAPYVAGSKVSAEVVGHGRRKKVKILKFRRRKHRMKQMGHRQSYTEVKITHIQ